MTHPSPPADPPGSSPLRRPPGRYDEPRTLPRPVLITGAALLGLLLTGLTYLAYDRLTGSRTAFGVLGYGVLSDHAVEVRFEVHKDRSATVVCVVRARDRDGAEVGSEPVTIGPSKSDPVVKVYTLTTTRRASTGEVTACSAPLPSPSP